MGSALHGASADSAHGAAGRIPADLSATVGGTGAQTGGFRPILTDLNPLFQDARVERRTVGERTVVGLHLGTPAQILYQSLELLPDGAPRNIIDAGCGQGETAIRLAHRFAQSAVHAIEFSPHLAAEARRLVASAERAGLIGAGAVTIGEGDFNSGFDEVFAKAELVYYYAQGSADPLTFARTLARTLPRGGKILEAGIASQLEVHLPRACRESGRESHFHYSEMRPYLRLFVLG